MDLAVASKKIPHVSKIYASKDSTGKQDVCLKYSTHKQDMCLRLVGNNTPAARGLEECVFHCLRKVSPAHPRSVGVWYIVQEFGW